MTTGIHHITAISGDPQKNLDFYIGFLGLRFVKKTVNFDDPYTYHFYFGNETGDPGTIITFFPWGENSLKGRRGSGQVTTITYSVPTAGMDFWIERMKRYKVDFTGPFSRFGNEIILFEDRDGIENELCFNDNDLRSGWDNGTIPEMFSIRGFSGATLTVHNREKTERLLTSILGFEKVDETANRIRYKTGDLPGSYLDLLIYSDAPIGGVGVGAVHHIAFRAESDEVQLKIRTKLNESDFSVTPVVDRMYFKSIYFREPGNVLFEVATDPPGFLIDETKESLGSHLTLPPWYENIRTKIESKLPSLSIRELYKNEN